MGAQTWGCMALWLVPPTVAGAQADGAAASRLTDHDARLAVPAEVGQSGRQGMTREVARRLDLAKQRLLHRARRRRVIMDQFSPPSAMQAWIDRFGDAQVTVGGFTERVTVPGIEGAKTALSPMVQWVRIRGGRIRMHADDLNPARSPSHRVRVRTFEIARSEVTVAQYARCVEAGACTEPAKQGGCIWKMPDHATQPVTCVTWSQAGDFSAWVGGRLPTEAEWVFVTRSRGQTQHFPWGDTPGTCAEVVMRSEANGCFPMESVPGCGTRTAWSVCAKSAGHSAQGVCDLIGNVWEWAGDVYAESDRPSLYGGAAQSEEARRVYLGGSWHFSGAVLSSFRFDAAPGHWAEDIGFRPVRDVR